MFCIWALKCSSSLSSMHLVFFPFQTSKFHFLQVSILMGYNGLHDLIENERPDEQPDRNLKDATDDFDLSLARKRFPSITLGSSPPVELYDETTSSSRIRDLLAAQRFFSNSMDEKWVDPNELCETWPSLYQPLSESGSSVVVEEDNLHQSSWSPTLESEGKSDHLLTVEENTENLHQSSWSTTSEFEGKSDHLVPEEESSSKVGVELQSDTASFDLFLDSSISCIPGLSKRHSRQLEECGFYTVGYFEIRLKAQLMEVLVFIQALAHLIYFFLPFCHAVAETVTSFSSDLCRFTECTN